MFPRTPTFILRCHAIQNVLSDAFKQGSDYRIVVKYKLAAKCCIEMEVFDLMDKRKDKKNKCGHRI